MPCDYSAYPKNWNEIRADVLLRANDCCERCQVRNKAIIHRSVCLNYWYDAGEDAFFTYPEGQEIVGRFDVECQDKAVRIVLTVAHLNHDVTDNRLENLRAWCQLCHLRYDAQHHAQNAAKTRMRRKAAGSLFEMEIAK